MDDRFDEMMSVFLASQNKSWGPFSNKDNAGAVIINQDINTSISEKLDKVIDHQNKR